MIAVRVWKRRMRVAATSLGAGVLAVLISLPFPNWYRASAVMLPPQDTDISSALNIGERTLTKFPAFGVLGEYFTPADIFKAILKSRTVLEDVTDRFDLGRVYRLKSREQTLNALRSHSDVKLAADGTITVSVEDRDPRRAAAMAMEFLTALDRYNIEKRNTQAHRTRVFLEKRVLETDSLLRISEEAIRRYQESHHTVATPSLNSGDVQSAADLLARKALLEVRLGVLRSYLREDNEEIIQTRTELNQIKSRVATLPALQGDLIRLMRDSKVAEQLYLLLTSELERARVREMMNTPTVQLLDPAQVPERHSRPHRAIVGLGATLLGFLASVVYLARGTVPAPADGVRAGSGEASRPS